MKEPVLARKLRLEIIHGGDAAGHQRRVQEWLEAMSTVTVIDVQHTCITDEKSRTGSTFSTLILFTESS